MALKASSVGIGKKAPPFVLSDKDGIQHTLKEFLGAPLVLYFYPKDNTPGCTLEAQEFSKFLAKFRKLGVKVVGISGGDDKTKRKFCEKFSLSVLLLSDTDFATSKKYGVYGKKQFMGRTFLGIHRRTFVLNKKGVIEKVFEKVTAEGHAQEVLEYVGSEASSITA